eukprot:137521-Pyramimonas_sp.AAC.1
MTSFYGSSCANIGKGALNTPGKYSTLNITRCIILNTLKCTLISPPTLYRLGTVPPLSFLPLLEGNSARRHLTELSATGDHIAAYGSTFPQARLTVSPLLDTYRRAGLPGAEASALACSGEARGESCVTK